MKKLFAWLGLAFVLVASAHASLLVQTGQFAAGTGAATTTVTSSFQGKAIIFYTHAKTANAESATAAFGVGFSDGTNLGSSSWAGNDAASTTVEGRGNWSTKALEIFTG